MSSFSFAKKDGKIIVPPFIIVGSHLDKVEPVSYLISLIYDKLYSGHTLSFYHNLMKYRFKNNYLSEGISHHVVHGDRGSNAQRISSRWPQK